MIFWRRLLLTALIFVIVAFCGVQRFFRPEPERRPQSLNALISRYDIRWMGGYHDSIEGTLHLARGRRAPTSAIQEYGDSTKSISGPLMLLYYTSPETDPIPRAAVERAPSWDDALREVRADSTRKWHYVYLRDTAGISRVIDCTLTNSPYCR